MSTFILNFHGLGTPPAGIGRDEARYWLPRPQFAEIADEIVALAAQSGSRPIALTFDDGNASDLQYAAPMLAERGLTAAFYVCAGRLGHPGYLDGADLRELVGMGMEIGSHGMDHVDWRRLSGDGLQREIIDARATLADVTGHRIESAGIPFGSYDRRVVAALKEAGFARVLTSDGGLAGDTAWLRPRNTITASWVVGGLAGTINQSEMPSARLKRWLTRAYKSRRSPPPGVR